MTFDRGLEPVAYVTGIYGVHLDTAISKLVDVWLPLDAGGLLLHREADNVCVKEVSRRNGETVPVKTTVAHRSQLLAQVALNVQSSRVMVAQIIHLNRLG